MSRHRNTATFFIFQTFQTSLVKKGHTPLKHQEKLYKTILMIYKVYTLNLYTYTHTHTLNIILKQWGSKV